MSEVPSVLLFDLGGVLVENSTFDELARLVPEVIDRDALKERWLRSPAVLAYECGNLSEIAFGNAFAAEWELREKPAKFLKRFAGWPRGPHAGSLNLLEKLRPRFTTAILSNCNATHWRPMKPLTTVVDHAFPSH